MLHRVAIFCLEIKFTLEQPVYVGIAHFLF